MPLQDIIHKFTVGTGSRLITLLLVFCGMVGLAIWYDLAAFKNLASIEGMDNAQLARNLSQGEGFTTRCLRPFSLYLASRQQPAGTPLLDQAHPDLSNAPLYPLLLALAMKAVPVAHPDTTAAREFTVYAPDLFITIFNQALFLIAVWMVFRLARRLLDEPAAWVTAGVFAGSELFWRFSSSGQSTMLLILLFLGLVEVLARIEPQTREGAVRGGGWLSGMALLAGVLTGLAGMTRYSFALLIIPVLGFLVTLPTPRRTAMAVTCGLSFLVVMAPWIVRNMTLCGAPFGTAGYAIFQDTAVFKSFDLERSLQPDFSLVGGPDLWQKLWKGLHEVLGKELPRLGGSWVGAFFLVGLLVPFRSPTLGRLRQFVLGSLVLLALAQALGSTGLSTDTPEVNSENLLVVLAPVVFLFGVSLFFLLVDTFGAKMPSFRLFAMTVFLLVASAPLILTLFRPVPSSLAYPPYYPPYIQMRSQWVEKDELIMSDFPWAVAWYGDRPSVWLSLKYREEVSLKYRNDFYVFDRLGKPIRALYLSARTMKAIDTQALNSWLSEGDQSKWEETVSDWDSFVLLGVLVKHEIPTGFPLKRAPFGLLPELFLGDSERNEPKPIKGE